MCSFDLPVAIILIVLGLFYLGGDAQGADVIAGVDPEMWQPANTNALLMLIYGLFGLAVAATVVVAVFQFGAALKDSPANAIKSLLGLVLLVVVLVIAWAAVITGLLNSIPYILTFKFAIFASP